jgi:4-hydroxy-tetrahydrodipicolinate reductase
MIPRVLVIGDGKMGRAVAQVAGDRGCNVVGLFGPDRMAEGLVRDVADVAIEFTQPASAAANVRACMAVGLPVVSGTTGWDAELARVNKETGAMQGAFLHAPNFSIGVQLLARLVQAAAEFTAALPAGTFAPHMIETHHAAKLDAPSGTAKMLARVADQAGMKSVETTSIRVGSVPGTHELMLDAAFEQVKVSHEARDRRVFAEGAVAAAKWLIGRKGVFSFEDILRK